jgi:hypothetical protein
MKNLEINDVVYKLRFGTAEEKIVIDKVVDDFAYSENKVFNRKYLPDLSCIRQDNKGIGGGKHFGESYIKSDESNSDKLKIEIKLRFIRNIDYKKFSSNEINIIYLLLKEMKI